MATRIMPAGTSSQNIPESFWDRAGNFVSRHKFAVVIGTGFLFVGTLGGIIYLSSNSNAQKKSASTSKASSKPAKTKKNHKSQKKEASTAALNNEVTEKIVNGEKLSEQLLAENSSAIDEGTVQHLPEKERSDLAQNLKTQGNEAFIHQKYEKALELYSKALTCKKDPVFYCNRAACFAALDNLDRVIDDTTEALRMDKNYVKALNRRSKAYEMKENYTDALLDATVSCILSGFADEKMTNSVERLLKKVAEKKAAEIMKTRPKKLPSAAFINAYLDSFRPETSPEFPKDMPKGLDNLKEAFNAMEAEKFEIAKDKAEEALKEGIEDPILNARALNLAGTFQFLENDSQQAFDCLSKSIELNPQYVQSYVKRAFVHLELGAKDLAWKDFTSAVQIDSSNPDIYYHRGQLYLILGEYANAAKDYQKSIDLDSEFVLSHIQLGVAQYKLGSVASSMNTFRRTIKKFSESGVARNYFGEILLDQGKFQKAVEHFDAATELEVKKMNGTVSVLPLINKALAIYQEKKDIMKAEEICRRALTLDPQCDVAIASLAQFLLQQGKPEEALKYFEKSIDLARTEAELINAISYVEATRTQIKLISERAELQDRLKGMTEMR